MKNEDVDEVLSKLTQDVALESFKLALWTVDLLEMSHKAGFFEVGVKTLRKGLREQIVKAEANIAVLKAERES